MTSKTIRNVTDGAPTPTLRKVQGVAEERGASIPAMTPVQSTESQPGAVQPSGQSQSSSDH